MNWVSSGAQMAALSVCIAVALLFLVTLMTWFLVVCKFTGATEAQTLKTWSLMETILGTTGAELYDFLLISLISNLYFSNY